MRAHIRAGKHVGHRAGTTKSTNQITAQRDPNCGCNGARDCGAAATWLVGPSAWRLPEVSSVAMSKAVMLRVYFPFVDRILRMPEKAAIAVAAM